MSEIIIDKNAKQITFTNNGIGFSQFGVADEILDLITDLQNQLQQKENIIKEVREYIETEYLSKFDDFEKPLRMTDKNDWNKLLEILDKENKQ